MSSNWNSSTLDPDLIDLGTADMSTSSGDSRRSEAQLSWSPSNSAIPSHCIGATQIESEHDCVYRGLTHNCSPSLPPSLTADDVSDSPIEESSADSIDVDANSIADLTLPLDVNQDLEGSSANWELETTIAGNHVPPTLQQIQENGKLTHGVKSITKERMIDFLWDKDRPFTTEDSKLCDCSPTGSSRCVCVVDRSLFLRISELEHRYDLH